ncbi:MAG: hypothetical protein GWN58_49720, partial [Anaerolineae bacterium]|nr:hypothetical protein [Anaerolineae bacterium]
PLNAILGFSHLLNHQMSSHVSAQAQQQIALIHEAGEHLLGLINQVLDFAQIDKG